MKKLLKVSLVAILAAGPVAAFAETAPIAYAGGATQGANGPTAVTASPVLATKSYVQGAYNELAEGINAEATKTGALTSLDSANFTSEEKASLATAVNAAMAAAKTAQAGNGLNESEVNAQINEAAGNGLSTSADGVLAVDLQDDSGLAVTSDGLALSDATKTSLGKANSALQSTNVGSGLEWDGTNSVFKLDTATTAALGLATTALQSAALEGLASEAFVTSTAATTLQSAKDYVDARGVVAANTWGADTTVLVNLNTTAAN